MYLKKEILFIILLLMITSVYAVDFTDLTKPITVDSSKPTFSIIIKSNPTSGYTWLLKHYDENLISPVSRKFYPLTDKKLVGAPGYEKWTFRVKSSGFVVPQTTNITLIYARSWDMQDAQPINLKVITKDDN